MCRLFGFRSNSPSRVHPSLVTEQNSLRVQSLEHKDGWGIAYYNHSAEPDVAHGVGPAHHDPDFDRVSGLVSSHAVLAHIRLKSVGPVHLRNAHPFVFGRWAFAHNGTIRNFRRHRRALEAQIAPEHLARVRGETDSERCFYLVLTRLERALDGRSPAVIDVARAIAETMRFVSSVTDTPRVRPSTMNFMMTNGEILVASRRGRTLFFSERKRRDRHATVDAPKSGARLEQLVIASEELSGEDHWHELPEDSLIGTGPGLTLWLWSHGELSPGPALPKTQPITERQRAKSLRVRALAARTLKQR